MKALKGWDGRLIRHLKHAEMIRHWTDRA
jgi:hypothetical protein